ncbi:MAG: hypothetical protein EOM67_06925 [Spirochaetia bacterium]|nr:hypothetical protein [Spirochaetia bacterium]
MNETIHDSLTFKNRFALLEPKLHTLYSSLYSEEGYPRLIEMIQLSYASRSEAMLELDQQRLVEPNWYQKSEMVGMMMYVNNFSETFREMPARLDYLVELGITYLHLMPIFKMPLYANDGGYAVSDFTSIDSRFGTDEEFNTFTKACHLRGISICIDFVLNHTSDEHEWALKAKNGDEEAQSRYFIFEDRTLPDEYERYVNEVFPVLAPGNFTYNAMMNSWVLTTFNHYQWDLNYSNHHVLIDMAKAMLFMSNRGVDIFRFDAIPYIWKEWGTNCRNLPQVHTLIKILRLILEIASPSTIIKGEVVMSPALVAPYFGTREEPECHVLYNVSLMVELWNALATRDTRMLGESIHAIPDNIPDSGCWVNYVRCHDDIGWGFNENKARELGFDPFLHKRFLINFYLGAYPGSFSLGELYESDPKTLDARNCGTLASLCGLEKAIIERDEYQGELAIKRILLMSVFTFVTNGIPVIYSGDELAMLNDYSYINDPHKARDSRFLHRGKFDWAKASKRDDLTLYSSQVFYRLNRYIVAAKGNPMMGNNNTLRPIGTSDTSVIAMSVSPRQPDSMREIMIVIANFSEHERSITLTEIPFEIMKSTSWIEIIQGKSIRLVGESILLGPYEILLLQVI